MAASRDQAPRTAGASAAHPSRREIACLATAPWNPYLRLLYEHLDGLGLTRAKDARFTVGWLWRHRDSVRFLHFHWPEGHYRHDAGSARLQPILSHLKLGLFALRLATAKLLGYRLVWTIHQVYPHDSTARRLDRAAAALLGRACDVFIAHERATAAAAEAELALNPHRVHVIPHGSYIGVYPTGRSRDSVREELSIADDTFVFLAFGELRLYKGLDVLLQAWSSADLARAALLVAGNPKDAAAAAAVRTAAEADPRIVPLLGFRDARDVAELFAAADAAVVARADGGTSGSLILALSLGVPVIFAERPAYVDLLRGEHAGWSFRPGDVESLRNALTEAADHAEAAVRGQNALAVARSLDWHDIAQQTVAVLTARATPGA